MYKELELYLKEKKYKKLLDELDWLKSSIEYRKKEFKEKLILLKQLRKELGYDKKQQ